MRVRVLAVVAAGLLGGCAKAPPKPEVAVTVSDATFETIDKAVKAHKGDVVLVDFWATWCGPCVESFPHLVDLHDRYAEHGLKCVSVSLDKASADLAVRAFLREHRAGFQNFHWKEYGKERREFDEHFHFAGGIPHMVAYNRAGQLVWDRTSQPLTSRGVEELVRRLLAEK